MGLIHSVIFFATKKNLPKPHLSFPTFRYFCSGIPIMKTVNRNLTKRQYVVIGVFVVVGVVYLLKLFSLQVLDKTLKQSADNNVLRFVTQYPARGKVYDRNGELLVYNEAVYDLMVVPGQVKDIDTLEFCRLLGMEPEVFAERLDKARKYSRVKASIFMSQIPKEDYAHIGEILYRYPGFYFQTRTLRHYPKAIAAHTLGDIGEVDQAQLDLSGGFTQKSVQSGDIFREDLDLVAHVELAGHDVRLSVFHDVGVVPGIVAKAEDGDLGVLIFQGEGQIIFACFLGNAFRDIAGQTTHTHHGFVLFPAQ